MEVCSLEESMVMQRMTCSGSAPLAILSIWKRASADKDGITSVVMSSALLAKVRYLLDFSNSGSTLFLYNPLKIMPLNPTLLSKSQNDGNYQPYPFPFSKALVIIEDFDIMTYDYFRGLLAETLTRS